MNSSEYVTLSVEVDGHKCSHCGLISFSSEDDFCPSCGNSFDVTDELMYGDDGIVYTDPEKIKELEDNELWECDGCGGINDNKPKNITEDIEIDCAGCGKNFDINNWIKPFWWSEELTFTEGNDYGIEFMEAYNNALNLARVNKKAEEFVAQYKMLHTKLVEEDEFERDNEMENLYNFLKNFIRDNSARENRNTHNTNETHKYHEVIERTGENSKNRVKNALNKKNITLATISGGALLLILNGLTGTYKDITIEDHKSTITTPMDKFYYENFEIFDRKESTEYRIYRERERDKKLELKFLGNGKKGNDTYETVDDGLRVERDVPGSCEWTYKNITIQVDDESRPIKETRTSKDCNDIYKNVPKIETKTIKVKKGDKYITKTKTTNYTKKVFVKEHCDITKELVTVGYKQKPENKKVKDEEVCVKEWYQPTKQVENLEKTIRYKAKQWQRISPYITPGTGLNPQVTYQPKVDERLHKKLSKTTYKVDVIIHDEDGDVKTSVDIKNESDWRKLRDDMKCNVSVTIGNKISNNSIVEGCFPKSK